MNAWKNILVVVVAVDRPLDHHVLRALQIELGNLNCRVTELLVFMDVCVFQLQQVPVRQSRH